MVNLDKDLIGHEFSLKDIIVCEGHSDFAVEDVDLSTYISRNIKINIPIIAAAMDTVCESEMAIALALQGGIGTIHNNLSIEKQAQEIERVKKYEAILIEKPITISPDEKIANLDELIDKTDYSNIPVVRGQKLVGMITKNHYLMEDMDLSVSEKMTKIGNNLVYVEYSKIKDNVVNNIKQLFKSTIVSAIPIVEYNGDLKYLVTRTDLSNQEKYKNVCRDEKGRLKVLAAIDTREYKERMEACDAAGADSFVVDTSHGYCIYPEETVRFAKKTYQDKDIIAGNVVTKEGVKYLIDAGADGVKINIGVSDICTTTEDVGIGRPEGSAVYECANVAREYNVPCIADGGAKSPGDILKYLTLGAPAVMTGNLLAGTDEAPVKDDLSKSKGVRVYRGMGSPKAMLEGGEKRYFLGGKLKYPEGIEKEVPYRGSVSEWVPLLMQGLKQGMQKAGGRNIEELYKVGRIVPRSLLGYEHGIKPVGIE